MMNELKKNENIKTKHDAEYEAFKMNNFIQRHRRDSASSIDDINKSQMCESNYTLFNTLLTDPIKRAKVLELLTKEGLVSDNDNGPNARKQFISSSQVKKKSAVQNRAKTPSQQGAATPVNHLKKQHNYESPSALHRRRALLKLQEENADAASDIASSTQSSDEYRGTPVPFEKLLEGVVAYCEVRSAECDRSEVIKTMMRAMGATVKDNFSRDITHVVFKDGTFRTFEKAKLVKAHLVSVLWLEATKRNRFRVPESKYPALGTAAYEYNLTTLCQSMLQDYDDILNDERKRRSTVFAPRRNGEFVTKRRTMHESFLHTNKEDSIFTAMDRIHRGESSSRRNSTSDCDSEASFQSNASNIIPSSQKEMLKYFKSQRNVSPPAPIHELTDEDSVEYDNLARHVQDSLELARALQIRSPESLNRNKSINIPDKENNGLVEDDMCLHITTTDESNITGSKGRISSTSVNKSDPAGPQKTGRKTIANDEIRSKSDSNLITNYFTNDNQSSESASVCSLDVIKSRTKRNNRKTTFAEEIIQNLENTETEPSGKHKRCGIETNEDAEQVNNALVNARHVDKSVLNKIQNNFVENADANTKLQNDVNQTEDLNNVNKRRKTIANFEKIPDKSLCKNSERNMSNEINNGSKSKRNNVRKTISGGEQKEKTKINVNDAEKKMSKDVVIRKSTRKTISGSEIVLNNTSERVGRKTRLRKTLFTTDLSKKINNHSSSSDSEDENDIAKNVLKENTSNNVDNDSAMNTAKKKLRFRKLYNIDKSFDEQQFRWDEKEVREPKLPTMKTVYKVDVPQILKTPKTLTKKARNYLKAKTTASESSDERISPRKKLSRRKSTRLKIQTDSSESTGAENGSPIKRPKIKNNTSENIPAGTKVQNTPKRAQKSGKSPVVPCPSPRKTNNTFKTPVKLPAKTSHKAPSVISVADKILETVNSRRSTLDFVPKKSAAKKSPEKKSTQKVKVGGITCTRMHKPDVQVFEQIVNKLGGFVIEDEVSDRTTHLVAGEPARTINMLRALARGCWIVKHDWLFKSLEAGKWMDEEQYEITEFSPAVQTCRVERQVFGGVFNMDLFKECGNIYVSRGSTPRRSDLEELVLLCGGTIVKSPRQARVIVGEGFRYDDVICVSEKWILECISSYKKKPFKNFILERGSSS